MCIWSDKAIDYRKGVDIYDPELHVVYSPLEAREAPLHIRSRLINKPRKVGCWVLTIEECNTILKQRRL
jgi:hypothetical protein